MSSEQKNHKIHKESQSYLPVDVSLREFLETEQNQNQGQVQSQSSIPDDIQPFTQQLSSEDMRAWYNPKWVGASNYLNSLHGYSTRYKRFKYQVKSGYIEKLAGPTPSVRRLSKQLVSIIPPLRENLKNINRFLFLDDNGVSTGQPVNTGDPQLDRIIHISRNDMKEMEICIKREIKKTDDKVEDHKTEFNGFNDKIGVEMEIMKKQLQNSTNRFENKFKYDGSKQHYLPITLLDGRSLTDAGLEELKSYQQIYNYDENQIREYLNFYNLSSAGDGEIIRERLLGYLGLEFCEFCEFRKSERKLRII